MCNRVDNYGLSISEASNELQDEIAENNYYYAEETNAIQRPAILFVLEHEGRKITHATWGINNDIPKDKPAKDIDLTGEKSHTF